MHFHTRSKPTRQCRHQLTEVHALFAQVVHGDMFTTKDRLHFHDLHRESHGLRLSTNGMQFSVHEPVAHGRPGIHVFHRCHAQDPPVGVERVILATRIVHIFKHFMPTDALGTTTVGAGGGEHLRDLSATMSARNHPASTARLRRAVVGIFANQFDRSELHHN